MTEQTAIIITSDYGSSLSTPTLRHYLTAAEIATADSANELSDASGWYAFVFIESAVHAAGWYALRAFVSGAPINRFVYFTGVDGETAIAVDNLPVGLPQTGQVIVTRPVGDDTEITFSFPVASATLSGTRRINNAGSTTALIGAISFLRTSGTKHLYSLSYNAADRPSDDGVVEYVFTDGTYSRTVVLKAVSAVLDSSARVKLHGTQDDYAPLKASEYTAPANFDITAIKAKTDNLPSDPADQSLLVDATNTVLTRLGSPAGASMSADIAAVKTDTGHLVSRITANLFSGITYMKNWFGVLAGKTADATTLAEFNATTAGAAFNNTTDSLEALRDRGDGGAWGGSAAAAADLMISTTLASVTSQTVVVLTAGSADNDVYNDQLVVITDAVTSTQKARMLVSDYVGSTKTLTLASAPGFTVAAGDLIAIIAVAGLPAGQRNQLALIGAGTRMTVKADLGTAISLKIGDTYLAARSTAKRIDVNDSDSSIYDMLTGAEIASIDFGLSNAKTIDVVTGTVDAETISHTAASGSVSAYTTVYVEVEVDAALSPFCGDYDIQITYDDESRRTAFSGKCELVRDFKA